MFARRTLVRLAALSSSLLIQACGGGGGGGGDETAPTIVSTSIVDGQAGVPRDATFVITFSEPVAASSIGPATVLWLQGATPVSWAAAVSGAVVTLTPSAPLANYAAHSVEITPGVTDVAGNALAATEARTVHFTTADDVAPGAPGTPTDPGAWSTTTTVRFTWAAATDDGSGVASYDLQVATATDGTGILFDGTKGTALFHDATAADGQTLYARARAIDAVGNRSEWSAWSDGIGIDVSPPLVGRVTDAGGWSASSVQLSWPAASDPAPGSGLVAGYSLQVATAADPVAVVETLPASGTSETYDATSPASWPENGLLYARVGAADAAGNFAWGDWSDGIRIDRIGPVFGAGVTDEGAWTGAMVSVGFGEATDAGSGRAGTYTLQVSSLDVWDPAHAYGTVPAAGPPATFDATALGILDAQPIHVRVSAVDAVGNEGMTGWSDGITLDLSAPDRPSAPVDGGAWSSSPTVSATWAPVWDRWSGVAGYRLQAATAPDGTGIFYDAEVGDVLAGAATGADGDTVYFRVQAIDAVGNRSEWSDWSDGITIDPSVVGTPGAPEDDGEFTASTSLHFRWEPPPEPPAVAAYVLQLGTTAGGAEIATVGGLAVAEAVVDVAAYGVGSGTTVYARVAAVDDLGRQGTWSASSDGITVDLTAPGAPGTPADRGDFDDTSVRFDWAEAVDHESGILTYQVEVYDYVAAGDLYTHVGTSFGPFTFTTFDAAAYGGRTLKARVRAQNGAGLWGDWSGYSDGVVVDAGRPMVIERRPWPGATDVGTNQDLLFRFSEPMDRASVEAALSLSCGPGCPKNGLAFFWSADGTQVTVVPDAADPVGVTNVDLLPERSTVRVVLTAAATDLAGNALWEDPQNDFTFTTADETPPRLLSLAVAGDPSPVAPPLVQGGFTLVATFDEEMRATQGGIRLETRQGSIEARYSDWMAPVQAAWAGGGQATYTLFGSVDIRVGDVVTVEGASPPGYNVTRATVLAVGSDGSGNTTFTVPCAETQPWTGGGQVAYPYHWSDATIAWTGPTTLALTVPPWVSLPPGADARVEVNSVSDLGGNWSWAEATLQVGADPAVDRVAPTIVSTLPLPGATGVARTMAVLFQFSEPMDASSLAGAFAVDAAGTPFEARYASDEMGPVLMFQPRAAPAGGTTVSVHLPGTAADLAGNLLGADVDFTFDVAGRNDFDAPVLYESLPPDGIPVDQVWQAQALFADGGTDMLERLDAGSVGSEDVRVTDLDTGLVVRGFRASARTGEGALELQPPPRGNGFGTGWRGQGIVSATASGGFATYTTWGEHGLQPGWHVEIRVQGLMGDGCLNATAVLADVPSPTTFTLPTLCGDGATASAGWAEWQTPRALLVELAVPPADGGTGILDFEGNPMAPTAFTCLLTPPGSNRFPVLDRPADLRIGVNTAPAGRQLSGYLRVRDADDDPVTVTISALGAAGSVPLPMGATLTGTLYGSDYRFGNDGPPTGASPPEMSDVNFPVSGYYPFVVALDDGRGGSMEYVRHVWVWAPADVPRIDGPADGIEDGGVLRRADATRPVVVENTDRPVLRWSNLDVANADFQALQYLELTARNLAGDGGPSVLVLDRTLTAAPFPLPLEPSFYAWFATQLKFSPGGTQMETQGWSLDFTRFLESTFVYGPANRAFAGREYGAARAHVVRPGSSSVWPAWDAMGTYAIEPLPGGGGAPVAVAQTLTALDGSPLSLAAYFGAAGDGRFMVTTTEPTMGLPLAGRGFVGRGGRLFAIAGEGIQDVSIELGAYRDPALVFPAAVEGTTFSFVQMGIGWGPSGVDSVEAMVGTALAGPATLEVSGITHGGTPNPPAGTFEVPYSVDGTGLMRVDVDGDGTRFASGYLGGAPGALLGALAQDEDPAPDKTFLLFVAQQYAWSGAETDAILEGEYRFVEHGAALAGGLLSDAYSVHGTLDFDGQGGFTFVAETPGGTMAGGGSYAVDATTGTVILAPDAASGGGTYVMRLGPDTDTALGVGTSDLDRAKVLVMSR